MPKYTCIEIKILNNYILNSVCDFKFMKHIIRVIKILIF